MADEELMLVFADGEHAAFELLFRRHERKVFLFALRYVSSPALAEELTQEVFLRVCKVAHKYSKRAKFTTWLFTITRNLCIDTLRRQKTRPEVSLEQNNADDGEDWSLLGALPDTDAPMASNEILRREFRSLLSKALESLPEEQREVFIMREFSGLKFREISEVINVSENTVKSRMRYALQSLKGSLASYEDFSFDADGSADAHHLS